MTTRLDAGGQQQRQGGVAVVVQANLPNARIGGTTPRNRSVCRAGVHSVERTVGLGSLRNTGARTDDVRERIRIMLT